MVSESRGRHDRGMERHRWKPLLKARSFISLSLLLRSHSSLLFSPHGGGSHSRKPIGKNILAAMCAVPSCLFTFDRWHSTTVKYVYEWLTAHLNILLAVCFWLYNRLFVRKFRKKTSRRIRRKFKNLRFLTKIYLKLRNFEKLSANIAQKLNFFTKLKMV